MRRIAALAAVTVLVIVLMNYFFPGPSAKEGMIFIIGGCYALTVVLVNILCDESDNS